jgi:hypothetical protein
MHLDWQGRAAVAALQQRSTKELADELASEQRLMDHMLEQAKEHLEFAQSTVYTYVWHIKCVCNSSNDDGSTGRSSNAAAVQQQHLMSNAMPDSIHQLIASLVLVWLPFNTVTCSSK